MENKVVFGILILALLISGCTEPANNKPLLGGDADEHGCIGSAGYTWCEEKQKCLRTWEEACEAPEVK